MLRDRGQLRCFIHRCLLWFEDEVLCLPLFEKFKVVAVGIGGGTGRTVVSGCNTLLCILWVHGLCHHTHRQGMAQLRVYQHLAQCLHDKSHQEIEEIRESKRGCSRVIVKHRSQSGKHWSSNLRNGLVVNVLTFPTHGSYTVAQWYMSLWQEVTPSVIGKIYLMATSWRQASCLQESCTLLHPSWILNLCHWYHHQRYHQRANLNKAHSTWLHMYEHLHQQLGW